MPDDTIYVEADDVRRFAVAALAAAGLTEDDAGLVVDVLLSADTRGIRSHGIARLPYFLSRLSSGVLKSRPQMRFTPRSRTSGVVDADGGVGIVASKFAVDEAMSLARAHGCGFVAVRRSSHFGYAGYWTALAQSAGFVGIAMSNGGGRTAPTFAVEGMLGTNPLSVAFPRSSGGTAFNLDMATSMVAAGKIETLMREGRRLPEGWVHSAAGAPRLDDRGKLEPGFPLLPLGGEGDEFGGHKGFGLGLVVELMCGALAGSPLSERLGETPASVTSVGHFFGVLQADVFAPSEDVAASAEATFETIRAARKEPGRDRVFIPGEPEAFAEAVNARRGVAVDTEVTELLLTWANRLGLTVPWTHRTES
ncbi:MAG TPA: Ldh family oxidoreductase [Acidimicrobiia bacterium]|nr:Ldh family oxidoreductase [Acidimicrobiia bacterium]